MINLIKKNKEVILIVLAVIVLTLIVLSQHGNHKGREIQEISTRIVTPFPTQIKIPTTPQG